MSEARAKAPAVGFRGPTTLGLMMATFMSFLDTTVVNVALPHMQGSLSASAEQATWVITSYMVTTAVMLPLSGWLAARLGTKATILWAVAGFTFSSMLCGIAADLPQAVGFRMLQGAASAPLAPLCQAVLLNITPPSRHGRAMALFMMGNVVAPVLGPVVGGWLTENYSWRWCFYINLPVGICALLLLLAFMPREAPAPRRFDFLGFGSLGLGVAALQLMLDRGPTLDWFGSREIWVEATLAAAALWVFVTHSLTAKQPLFPPALARDRNLVSAVTFVFFFNTTFYAGVTVLPLMMQGVMGYSPLLSGMISMPRGLLMLFAVVLVGRLDATVDRRLLVGVGQILCLLGYWQMTSFDLSMSPEQIMASSLLQGLGQAFVFVPIATLSFATIDPALRADAATASNLLRNVGGTIGIAALQGMTAFNGQTMHASLAEHVTRPNAAELALSQPALGLDVVRQLDVLNAEITRQATMVAYVDAFWAMLVVGFVCTPLLFFLRARR